MSIVYLLILKRVDSKSRSNDCSDEVVALSKKVMGRETLQQALLAPILSRCGLEEVRFFDFYSPSPDLIIIVVH